jgi:hypothetical protein
MTTAIVVAILAAISILAGLAAAKHGPEEGKPAAGPAVSTRRRAAWFCAGFLGWPFLASIAIFFIVCCWPFLFTSEEDIAELERLFAD